MIQKKVCMIGTSSVGKTSLVAKYVRSIFSDKYLTSVGVKIDKKTLTVDGTEVTLVIWDLAGDDDFQRLQMNYLRGTSGYLFVADGTRAITLDQVIDIRQRIEKEVGAIPCVVLALNKADLDAHWQVDSARIASLTAEGWEVIPTSAKDGRGVEEAFSSLARRMLPPKA
jgi:small GTP-binding protein